MLGDGAGSLEVVLDSTRAKLYPKPMSAFRAIAGSSARMVQKLESARSRPPAGESLGGGGNIQTHLKLSIECAMHKKYCLDIL